MKIVAGSGDAYRKFRKFFANCLKEFGHHKAEEFEKEPDLKEKNVVKEEKELVIPNFDKEDESLIQEFKISVRRNLSGFPLAAALSNK